MKTRLTYHDACSLSRLSDPWTPMKENGAGWAAWSRGLRDGAATNGIYAQPRDILKAIPGVDLVEMPRTRENAFCCGAGRGTQEAFPDFANWAAAQRLEEVREIGAETLVTACPWCKNNFAQAVKAGGERCAGPGYLGSDLRIH